MRSAQRGAVSLRAAGAAATIAGLGLLSFGTLTASAGSDYGTYKLSSTPNVKVVADGWSLTDVIVLTKTVGDVHSDTQTSSSTTTSDSTGPSVQLFSGDCDNEKDTDEDASKDKDVSEDKLLNGNVGSDVVANEDHTKWTATTESVKVEKTGDYHFQVSWNGQSGCEDLTVAKAEPTATPTPAPTATPTPAPTATPLPTATPTPVATSSVAAVTAIVKTPSTGVDLPFGLGGGLLASGLGFLAFGARRRRAGK